MTNTIDGIAARKVRAIFQNNLTVQAIAEHDLITAAPGDPVDKVRRRMEESDIDVIFRLAYWIA